MNTEHTGSLWSLAASPLVWAGHFVLSYITAAIYCAKVESRDASLAPVRGVIVVFTVIALVIIARTAWKGWSRHHTFNNGIPHDDDTPADSRRFLGFATWLLSGLSFIATVFVALTIIFVKDCN